jgi:hypothetical protein
MTSISGRGWALPTPYFNGMVAAVDVCPPIETLMFGVPAATPAGIVTLTW